MALASKVIRMDDHRNPGPQVEDGFVRIANELYDAMLEKLSSYRHIKIVMAIVRKTYGYGKKEDDITISQLAEITGIHRNNVGKALSELEGMGVINPTRAGAYGLILGLNKHHTEWTSDEVKARGPGRKAINLIEGDSSNQNVASKQSKQLPTAINLIETSNQNVAHNRQPQKTTPIDNSNSVHPAGRTRTSGSPAFDAFWSAYPRKDKKADALKAFAKLSPDADLLADMVARVELLKHTDDWLKDAGQFVPLAASWLNGRRWEDEAPQLGYTPDELRVIDTYNRLTDGTNWPEAKAAPYSRERAGLIRAFLGYVAKGMESVEPYFRRVAESVPAADTTGFDWLMRRETYLKVREGVHRQRGDA